ncbi:MAG: HxlR family transcriptional regulator [uncultured bacterium (gcode 4)]|uniref:HxlR family transcriptional regulator n=1 Tax=uncultured bacterium (gcode 4) TaxID=1234023 RepID=K2H2Y4_9BACT|nr:MAG: HxlR family transcriptional regulator [uncultured bacterium (gcode 4)]
MHKKCPVMSVFWLLSKRWMLLILRSLNDWKETFGDIKRSLIWISSKILSERLSELQMEWYVDRVIIQEKPIKIRYSVTDKWKSLWDCIWEIDNWARLNTN